MPPPWMLASPCGRICRAMTSALGASCLACSAMRSAMAARSPTSVVHSDSLGAGAFPGSGRDATHSA